LIIKKETIKVSGEADVELDIKFTHRGPLMDPVTMQSGSVLFGSEIPDVDFNHKYSHMWGGMRAGDNFIGILEAFANGKGVKEIYDMVEAMEDGYKGIPMNMVMADNSGDIGYVMLAPVPNRKNKTPYIGNRVLNGETTDNDWDGYLPATELPRTYNPDKGYVITANNRHMPDHCANDIGATSMSTGRAMRIDEMISGYIKDGHKITVEDMGKIQQDDTDVIARDFTPLMIKVVKSVVTELTTEQLTSASSLMIMLDGWNGRMSEESI
jgi:penicillin amidase